MVCCLRAPSHCLNQFRVIINEVLWHYDHFRTDCSGCHFVRWVWKTHLQNYFCMTNELFCGNYYPTQTLPVIQFAGWKPNEVSLCFTPSSRHHSDVIMSTMASQITSLMIAYSTVYWGVVQRKHQSSVSQAFVREFTGDWWIPRIKDQYRGKCFHLMTSSWKYYFVDLISIPNLMA